MLILDFNGLPGCGKSTYASELYKVLNNQNITCEFLNRNEYFEGSDANQRKFIKYIRLLIPRNFFYIIELCFKFYKKEKIYNRNLSIKDKIWKWLRIGILKDKAHIVAKSEKKGILIIDQGIIQDYVDYTLDKEINDSEILEYKNIYRDIKDKIILVNLNIEQSVSLSRVYKRNRGKYDVDKMTIKKLNEFLELYNTRLKYVREIFNQDFINIELDVSKDEIFDENIEKLSNIIKESSEK